MYRPPVLQRRTAPTSTTHPRFTSAALQSVFHHVCGPREESKENHEALACVLKTCAVRDQAAIDKGIHMI